MGDVLTIDANGVAEMALRLRTHFGVDRFNAWVVGAKPGAQQIYGVGVSALTAASPGVARRMRDLQEAGLVQLVQRRARVHPDFPFDYLAVRTSRPMPVGFPKLLYAKRLVTRVGQEARA